MRTLLFVTALIASMYHLSSKEKIGFRYQPFLKPFIIGLCWAFITIFLSSANELSLNLEWNIIKDDKLMQLILLCFIIRIFEIGTLSILNDVLHINTDKINNLTTLPILLGINKTLIASAFLSLPALILAISWTIILPTNFYLVGKFLIGFVLLQLSIFLIKKKVNHSTVEIFLDSILAIEGLCGLLILSYQFL
jgi:4-hydroxybenzoate polyprenyltransferase